jgi:hypothetical protein
METRNTRGIAHLRLVWRMETPLEVTAWTQPQFSHGGNPNYRVQDNSLKDWRPHHRVMVSGSHLYHCVTLDSFHLFITASW